MNCTVSILYFYYSADSVMELMCNWLNYFTLMTGADVENVFSPCLNNSF